MLPVRSLDARWHHALDQLISGARDQLLIAAPFITETAVRSVTGAVHSTLRDRGRIDVITDLSPVHVSHGTLEPVAIQHLMSAAQRASLIHIPRFHAKVYIADGTRAIVTSANLTTAAFFHNVEYGFEIVDPALVRIINKDLAEVSDLGVQVGAEQLAEYVRVADRVRATFERQQDACDPALRQAFLQAVQVAGDDLIRYRLAGGAMHTVFAKTIVYVLRKHGPLPTTLIHEHVQRMHPDLCDDSIDRVIAGQHFGRRWKHAVRTAQQRDKRLGLITNRAGLWSAVGP
jgi:hypothetical protein